MKISDIKILEEHWPRTRLDPEVVREYMRLYASGKDLKPLLVQTDNNILIEGHRRIAALQGLRYDKVEVVRLDIS